MTQELSAIDRIHRRRLLRLARHLCTKRVQKHFDIRTWVGENWKGKPDLSCGTTACALGHATTVPEFRRLGLRMKFVPGNGGENAVRGFVHGRRSSVFAGPEESDVEACRRIFGLGYEEFDRLFMPSSYRSRSRTQASQVADRIRELVADKYGERR